jgi:hypothetical protein
LCQERLSALIELSKKPTVDLTPENISLLQQVLDLAIDAQEECPVFPPLDSLLMAGLHGDGGQDDRENHHLQTHFLHELH